MLVSTKGRYALRLLLMLAEQDDGSYLRLDSIAEEEEISEKYLETIARTLGKAGLIEGQRGRGGGYRLTRKPWEYPIGEILRLTEGSLAPVACLDCKPNRCPRAAECKTLSMWENLETIISNFLDQITLDDLRNPSQKGDYQI